MLATTFWELPISSMLAGMRALLPQSVILKLQRTKINKKQEYIIFLVLKHKQYWKELLKNSCNIFWGRLSPTMVFVFCSLPSLAVKQSSRNHFGTCSSCGLGSSLTTLLKFSLSSQILDGNLKSKGFKKLWWNLVKIRWCKEI